MAVQSSAAGLALEAQPTRSRLPSALLFAGIVAVLLASGDKLLVDPDTQWHVKVGADIWRDKAVPWVDAYSHTFRGQSWIAKEWLSQVLMFGAQAAGGMAGLVLATAAAVALVLTLMFSWLSARLREGPALMLTLLALILITPHILARPHVFALIPLLLWAKGLFEALEEGRTPKLWLLGVLALWANLHNSVTIAYPIAALLALEALIRAPAEKRLATALRWGAFGLAALAAGCLTPYGHRALIVTFTLFGSGEQLPFIHEWDPIGWSWMGVAATVSAVAAVAALAAGGARNAVRIMLIAALAALFVRHVRFLDIYAVVAPLALAAPLALRFPGLRPEPAGVARSGQALPIVGLIAAVAASVALLATSAFQPGPLVTPRAALAAARAAGVADGPLYNNHDYGGFLISEGVPTFIDGRTDQIYLGGFIGPLMTAIKQGDRAGFIDFIGRYGVTWAIVPSTGEEASAFEATPGWRLLHRDEIASVFVKR